MPTVEMKYEEGTFIAWYFGGDESQPVFRGKVVGYKIKCWKGNIQRIYYVEVFPKYRSYPNSDIWEVDETCVIESQVPEQVQLASVCGMKLIVDKD